MSIVNGFKHGPGLQRLILIIRLNKTLLSLKLEFSMFLQIN